LDAAGTGFQRFDNMSKSFSQAVKNEFLPAVAALIEIPIIVQELKQSTDAAGQSLQTSSLAIKQAFEENRNNFFSANSSIEKLQNLIKNASSAASGLNTSATAFSSIIQNFQDTSILLNKVNYNLAPVATQLEEFLNGLRNVAILSKNIDELINHLGEFDKVTVEAVKVHKPLAEFNNILKEIQTSLRKISSEKPGIWDKVLTKLGLNKP